MIHKYSKIKAASDAQGHYQYFLGWLEENLKDPSTDKDQLIAEALFQLEFGQKDYPAHLKKAIHEENTGQILRLEQLNPQNTALEPEYYGDIDKVKYARNKPLLWMWAYFDRLPMSRNTILGFPLRQLLGRYLFKHMGQNVKIFHNVEMTYGYNLSIGDNVVIHREVLLDDRGGIIIHKNVSISDYANVYSHTHSSNNISDVTLLPVELGENSRVTYHATVLAGSSLGKWAIVGAMGLATRPLSDFEIRGGVPAKHLSMVTPEDGVVPHPVAS